MLKISKHPESMAAEASVTSFLVVLIDGVKLHILYCIHSTADGCATDGGWTETI